MPPPLAEGARKLLRSAFLILSFPLPPPGGDHPSPFHGAGMADMFSLLSICDVEYMRDVLEFLPAGGLRQRADILAVDSSRLLPRLRALCPYARITAVTRLEEVPELPALQNLDIERHVIDKRKEKLPFEEESFDLIINRHGSFDPLEIRRLLRPGGMFVTQQVGSENDRDLVEAVLPGTKPPFPEANLETQRRLCEEAGLEILRAEEAFRPIRFDDIGAFVWFARIIEWEFPGFSVERCFGRLLGMQRTLEQEGCICGTVHRFFLKVRKPGAEGAAGTGV